MSVPTPLKITIMAMAMAMAMAMESDIDSFEQTKNLREEENFLQEFRRIKSQSPNYQSIEDNDIYSLLLGTSIVLDREDTVKRILNKDRGNILTTLDSSGYSPISKTLYSGNITIKSLIKNYISNYIVKNKELKVECSEEDKVNMLTLMRYPQFEHISRQEYIEILEPLYTNIDPFIELLDTFDDYE